MATVPARKREPRLGCPYVVSAVAEVGRQHLASNKLARSAPKRVAVRVNGGLGGAVTGTRVPVAVPIETMSGDSAFTPRNHFLVEDRARPRVA